MNKTLRYGSAEHRTILNALNARKDFSIRKFSDLRERWVEDEEKYRAYIKETDHDKLRKNRRKDGIPQYTTLEVPYSYGLLLAAHTYWTSVFLARNPVLQFQARHGEGYKNEQAVEALLDYQVSTGGFLVPYYLWLMDTPKYGRGIIGTYWEEEVKRVSRIVEVPETFAGVPIRGGRTRKKKRTIEVPGYHGNKVFNVRPQDFWPDPRVSLVNFQKGEFCARYLEISWLDLVEGKFQGEYMNLEVVQRMAKTGFDSDRDLGSSQQTLPDAADTEYLSSDINQVNTFSGYEIFVRLIPRDWKLGDSERPELWVFTVVKDVVIVRARPLGELHDSFPFDTLEYEMDGYQLFNRSLLQVAEPLQETLNWLVNTHFFNIRKVLNNQFVADPARVNIADIGDPSSGLVIRLRPSAYGTPVDQAIKQLQTVDVTQTHLADTRLVTEMMQRVIGVNDSVMGVQAPGGRKTATEVRGATNFSINRLKTQAEYMSAMGFAPHAQRILQTTQQFYSLDRMYKIAGDLLPGQPGEMNITPESIAGFYDFVPVDGTMPVDRFALANLWKEIMVGMKQFPELAMKYDIGSIFAYTAQLAGAKNIKRFQIKMVPDGMIDQQAQAGNLVPLGGPSGRGSPGRAVGGGEEAALSRVLGAGQIPRVGPVG